MRFAKIFTALAAVTGITSAFQVRDTRGHNDVVDLDGGAHDAMAHRSTSDMPFSGTAFLRNRAAAAAAAKTSGKSKTPKCGTAKKRGELSRRTNAELYDDEWWVMMGESCPATLVQAGQTISVMDISGCSGLFFFSGSGAAGKTSAYHITAGEEASEALAAARSAKAAGTTDYYSVYAASASKIADIEKQVKAVLPSIKEHKTATYTLNTKNRDERHRMDNKPGSKDVTLSTYTCD